MGNMNFNVGADACIAINPANGEVIGSIPKTPLEAIQPHSQNARIH